MNVRLVNEAAQKSTQFLAVETISIDPVVQRSYDAKWAADIARNFDPKNLGVLHISRRPDGTLSCVDGQHRLGAVKLKFGDNGHRVECKLYDGLSVPDEAALFKSLNNFKRPTRYDEYFKGVTAKNPVDLGIDQVVRACGFRVERFGRDGIITAVGSLYNVYLGFQQLSAKRHFGGADVQFAKPELLRDTLLVIKQAWGDDYDGLRGEIMEGIGRVLASRGNVIDVPALVKKLASHSGGAHGIIGSARGRRVLMGGKLAVQVAEHLIDHYNKGRRTNLLESLRGA